MTTTHRPDSTILVERVTLDDTRVWIDALPAVTITTQDPTDAVMEALFEYDL